MNTQWFVGLVTLTPLVAPPGVAQEVKNLVSLPGLHAAFGPDAVVGTHTQAVDPAQMSQPGSRALRTFESAPDGAVMLPEQARTAWPTAIPGQEREPERELPNASDLLKNGAAAPAEALYYDVSENSIWIVGSDYKAHASQAGFTFVPFLGSDAPKNFPVGFSLQSVAYGGETFALSAKPSVALADDRIEIDRGSVQVWYDMELGQVEQSFQVEAAGIAADLVVTLDLETELSAQSTSEGYLFQNDLGGVRYEHALVFDAQGKELELPIELVDGQIQLRVPADYMAQAVAPVVVDPILLTYQVGATQTRSIHSPDVAYDITANAFGVAYIRDWSATDRDVRLETRNGNSGAELGAVWVDISTDDWHQCAVANDNVSDSFLVVCMAENTSGYQEVWGRAVEASTLAMSPKFMIGDANASWDNHQIDVGGSFTSTSRFKVVWTREFSGSGLHQVRSRTVVPVNPHNTTIPPTVGSLEGITNDSFHNHTVRISKSTGEAAHDEWRVVYITDDSANSVQRMHSSRYSGGGVLLTGNVNLFTIVPPFIMVTVDISDGLVGIPGPMTGSAMHCMPIYYSTPNGPQVWAYGLDQEFSYGGNLIKQLEHSSDTLQHGYASVSVTASRYIVAYVDFDGLFGVKASALDWTNQNRYGVNERKLSILADRTNFYPELPGIGSRYSGGWTGSQYVTVAASDWNGAEWDMESSLIFASLASTPGRQYCTGTANSSGDYGFITMTGSDAVTETKTLRASALPLNQFAYFLAGEGGFGTTVPPGSAGTLCLIGGDIGRYNLGVEIKNTGTAGAIMLEIEPTQLRGPNGPVAATAGATWNFQAWHREDGGSSNFTNAISLEFE